MGVNILTLTSNLLSLFQKVRVWTQIWLQNPYTPFTTPPVSTFHAIQSNSNKADCLTTVACAQFSAYKSNSSYRSGSHLQWVASLMMSSRYFLASCFSTVGLSVSIQYSLILMCWWEGNHHISVGIWRIKTCWRETLIFQSEQSVRWGSVFPNTAFMETVANYHWGHLYNQPNFFFFKYCN